MRWVHGGVGGVRVQGQGGSQNKMCGWQPVREFAAVVVFSNRKQPLCSPPCADPPTDHLSKAQQAPC